MLKKYTWLYKVERGNYMMFLFIQAALTKCEGGNLLFAIICDRDVNTLESLFMLKSGCAGGQGFEPRPWNYSGGSFFPLNRQLASFSFSNMSLFQIIIYNTGCFSKVGSGQYYVFYHSGCI